MRSVFPSRTNPLYEIHFSFHLTARPLNFNIVSFSERGEAGEGEGGRQGGEETKTGSEEGPDRPVQLRR